jgi:hypothetical protein
MPVAEGRPSVRFQIPGGIPVSVSQVEASAADDTLAVRSYRVANHARAGLVTLVTMWRFDGFKSEQPAWALSISDSWELDTAFLPPQSDGDALATVAVRGAPVSQTVATVVYAEFDDGTRVGPLKDHFHGLLRCDRMNLVAKYQELLAYYSSGASVADLEQRLMTTPGLHRLKTLHATGGMDAVLGELQKARTLAP